MRSSFSKYSVAILLSVALLNAAPAIAVEEMDGSPDSVPVLLDAWVLRPAGLISVVEGFLQFVVIAPVVAITRPTNLGTLWHSAMDDAVQFTFRDPLGTHPE